MGQDSIVLIRNDHREVERLFDVFTGPETPAERARTVGQIVHELVVHAAIEEMVLYPAVRRSLADGKGLTDDAIHAHQQVDEVLAELDGMDARDGRVTALVGRLQTLVGQHVREEETELLPAVEAAVDRDEIEDMGVRIERAKETAQALRRPGAPPANIIVGVPTDVLDRVREALDPSR